MAKKNKIVAPTAPSFGRTNEVLRGQNLRGALAAMEQLIDAGKVLDTLDVECVEVAIQTSVEFDADATMESLDNLTDELNLHCVYRKVEEVTGVELSSETIGGLTDLINEHVVEVLKRAFVSTLDNLFREGQGLTLHDGFVHVRENTNTLLSAVREGVEAAIYKGQVELRAIERETIKLHNERCAHERVRLAPVAPPVEAAVVAPVAPPVEAATVVAPVAAPKPRKPRTVKAPVVEAAPVPGRNPVDVAEALEVLADFNATPEAIEAALALLA